MKWFVIVLLGSALVLPPGCSAPRGPVRPVAQSVDTLLFDVTASAQEAYQKGDLHQAALMYYEAVQRAEQLGDSYELGQLIFNLAVCQFEMNLYGDAQANFKAARREMKKAGMDTTEALLFEARAAFREGNIQDCREAAQAGLKQAGEDQLRTRFHFTVMLAKANLVLGEHSEDQQEFLAQNVDQVSSAYLKAEYAGIQGARFMLENEPVLAAEKFDEEADLRQEAGDLRGHAEALSRAGVAFREIRAYKNAGDRFYRSSRSYLAQDLKEEGALMLAESRKCADEINDRILHLRLDALTSELSGP